MGVLVLVVVVVVGLSGEVAQGGIRSRWSGVFNCRRQCGGL